MPPPHLSLSENMNQPSNTDSPRSASSSTLIITALPSLPGGMASSSLSKLVELDPINGDSTRGAEDVSTPATAAGQAAKSPRPNLRLHTMPSNPHSQSQSQSLDRMSHKGFIEPHRSHLPRRAAKSKSKEKGRRNTVGEEEKIQRLEVVRMQRIESVATQPDFESTPDATKAEVEIERIPSAQTDNTDLPLERFAVPHTSPLPPSQNQPHTSGLPYPLPLMSPGLPHPAMGLTMGLMQAAERKAKEREEELRVAHDEREKGREDRERTPIPATVGGVKGTPYLTLNLGAGDEDGEEDEEAEESRERVAGVGVGLGLGGVGGLGGLGLGVSIGALSPPIQTSHPQQKQQRRSASQTRVPLGLEGISGLPPVPQTAPVGGPVYSGIGGGGGGGRATGTGPTAFNLPRRHHRRGRDKGKVQSPSPSPNANVQDVLKAVNTPLPMSPPQPVARPLGFGLINDTTTRPQLHHREDSMDIRGRQGEGEVRLLRVERVERVEKGVDGDVNLEDEDEDDSTREVKAAIDSHAPNGPHTLHLPNTAHTPNQRNQLNAHNDNVVHSLDDGSLSIERRMRSPGPAMYRTRQAVVREEAVGVGLGGISGVGGVGSLRKIGPKAGLGLEDEEMKRKERLVKERREEDKRSLQVVGWTRVEVGFLSDAEERDAGVGGGGGKGRGMPFVELRVVEPCLDEPKDDNDNSNQNDARSMRLYLPAVKPDGLDEDSSRADASKSVPTSAPDESTPVLGVEFQETQEPDGLAPSSIPFPVTLTPITPLATLPPAPIASLPNPGAVPKSEKPPASSSSSPSPTPSPYLDGIPSLTFSQLREGCAFISKWLGGDSFVDHTTVMQGHDVVDVDAKKKTKEEDSERRWIRILAPRWRPEDALALGLCWAVGVESGAGRVEHAGVLNENENEDEESVKQEDKEEVVVKLEDEQEEEAKASPFSDEEKADVLIEDDRGVEKVEEAEVEVKREEVEVEAITVDNVDVTEVKVKEEEVEPVLEFPEDLVAEAPLADAPAVVVENINAQPENIQQPQAEAVPERERTGSAARLRTSHSRTKPPHRQNLVVPLGVNDLQVGGFGIVDNEIDIMGVDVQAGSQLLASPPDASELMETEYTPYHLLAMRLLDDDASWLTRGCVGVGAETSGVVVVADVEEDVVLAPNGGAVDADTDANAEIVPGGTAAGLLNESNKDTIESSLEDWKLRGYVSGPEAGAEGGADGDRKRGRTRMRTRKSHIREAAVVGLSSQSDDGKNEKAKVKQDKEKKVEKPRETLTKWVGLRDEWRGILSYDGLMMLGKLASGPDASVDDAAAHADVAA